LAVPALTKLGMLDIILPNFSCQFTFLKCYWLIICLAAKNGYYAHLVTMVRDAFLLCELVRIDCQGLERSDYKKIGCKLRVTTNDKSIFLLNQAILITSFTTYKLFRIYFEKLNSWGPNVIIDPTQYDTLNTRKKKNIKRNWQRTLFVIWVIYL
jgi:hypothetical protein